METAYTFTEQDIVLFFREYSLYRRQVKRKRGPRGRTWIALYYLLLLVIPVSVFVTVASLHAGLDIATVAAVSTGFAWRWPLNLLWYHWQWRRLRASPHFLGPHIVRTSPEGLSDRRADGEWTAYWPHVVDIGPTKNFLLFLHDTEAVTPVPRHSFSSSVEAEKFHQMSRAYRRQSVWPPAPCATGNSEEPSQTPEH